MVERGVIVRGLLIAEDIPPKVVSARSRVHKSTMSRFINGIIDVSEEQYARILMAIGEVRAEQRASKA